MTKGNGADGLRGSLWEATASAAPASQPLEGEARADVAVIGGGFCGLSCALRLAEAGVDVLLLEAEGPGWGASGRNGGQVIPCFKDDPETLIARLGPELGERMSALGASGGDLVADLVSRYAIDCAYRRQGWLLGVRGNAKLTEMEGRARQWRERGRPVRLLDRREAAALIGADLYDGAYLDPEGGAVNPLSFARGLARAATQQGARLHSQSPALEVTQSPSGGWRVRTPKGAVLAREVVVATGAYSAGLLPKLRRSVLPVQSLQIATPPLPPDLRGRVLPEGHVVSDSRRLLIYFRQQEDGRLVFGGRGSLSGQGIRPDHLQAVYRALRDSFPMLGDIGFEYAWAGLVDITADRRLRVHAPAPGLTAVVGFNGRGVSIAPAVGRAVAEALIAGSLKDLPLPVTPLRPVPFHGLRLPAMAAAVAWYRFRDRLDGGGPPRAD